MSKVVGMDDDVMPVCDMEVDPPFHDFDMLQVVWHGHYYKYFEMARTALLRKYDFDVPKIQKLGYYMVVIESHCRYIRPIRYGRRVRIKARVTELEFRIRIEYLVLDAESGQRLSRGYTIQATVDGKTHELCFNTPQEVIEAFAKSPLVREKDE